MDAQGSSRWFRINLWLHRWCSLVATLPFLILCLTGTVLIFHDEIDVALGNVPTAAALKDDAMPLAASVANVMAQHPDERALSVGIDPEDHPGVLLVVTAPKGDNGFEHARLRFADLASAQPIASGGDPDKTFTGFLLKLHSEWFLGPLGEVIGSLIALLVLISLVSGIVVYAPYVKRVAFGMLRRGRGKRLYQLDLHNFLGAVVLGWAFVVTVTGVLLGLGTIAKGVWQVTELPKVHARFAGAPVDALHPPADVNRVYEAVRAGVPPEWHVISIIFPGTDFSTDRHYTAFLAGEGIHKKLLRIALVDGETGELRTVLELPWYLKAILVSQPLHFGDYGGLPLKILWTVCVWLTLFITANGAWLWWDRRRKRKRSPVAATRTAA